MPEIPDIVYIKKKLMNDIIGEKVSKVVIKNPVIIRSLTDNDFVQDLTGETFTNIRMNGHFLCLELLKNELVVNFMLSGRFQYQKKEEKPVRDICLILELNNDDKLNYSDNKSMGKIYLTKKGNYEKIPGFNEQGYDILSNDFTLEIFKKLIAKKKCQARVFIMDHTLLSAIGNAYADEILFDARIHPKTPCNELTDDDVIRLFTSIKKVIAWGIEKVEEAGKPIEKKVRDHMKVRNRKNMPCLTCGTIIRRENVLGYDTFFCPECQVSLGKQFIPWNK